MKKFFFIPLIFICSFSYAAMTARKDIKVGIIINAQSFVAASNEEFIISDASNRKFKLSKGRAKLSFSGGQLLLDTNKIALPAVISSAKGVIFADKKAYRGYLSVVKSAKGINVINVLSVEDYLKGVVAREASPGWPLESLKAQAVISRTYTLANLNKHKHEGFDMCAQTHCQVYGGASSEYLPSNKAVIKTKGEVLVYGGKFAQTVFHANCGGHTEDPKYVWNWAAQTPPYLEGVKCVYCKNAPHSEWEQTIDESFIRSKLSSYRVGKIKSIKVKGKTPAGSAIDIEILHSNGNLTFNAYKFRLAVDAWKIKSATFESIEKNGTKFTFKGKGWGHKVGLCQWGAKGMADAGKKYKRILSFYYPKTEIVKVEYK
ncbi:MAG: SpoIID/LytB domain-containing protein [Endomicrobium sp.]|jgi:stage II sporulation protein D|nr:SpoIID/LytB domain-containing protein [Endomicrobium sp.]